MLAGHDRRARPIFIALGDWSPLRVAGDTEHDVARLLAGLHVAGRLDDLV
jgi:hypothetical protein